MPARSHNPKSVGLRAHEKETKEKSRLAAPAMADQSRDAREAIG